MTQRRLFLTTLAIALTSLAVTPAADAQAFDHSHAAWTALLKKHVVVLQGGRASQVRYAGIVQDQAALRAYLTSLSAVSQASFDTFSKPQQMAFLINAYNAFTVELILSKYPKLASIKDLGSFLSSPWKPKIVPLLGSMHSLDNIEHDMLRARGRYDEPRVHFAVNCASIGCPALREEAFTPDKLEAQLEEQTVRFMSDRSRNRWNATEAKLEVSKIFDWFGEDFRSGFKGITSAAVFYAKYAAQLADAPAERERIRAMSAPVSYLEYDWKLNDAR